MNVLVGIQICMRCGVGQSNSLKKGTGDFTAIDFLHLSGKADFALARTVVLNLANAMTLYSVFMLW